MASFRYRGRGIVGLWVEVFVELELWVRAMGMESSRVRVWVSVDIGIRLGVGLRLEVGLVLQVGACVEVGLG